MRAVLQRTSEEGVPGRRAAVALCLLFVPFLLAAASGNEIQRPPLEQRAAALLRRLDEVGKGQGRYSAQMPVDLVAVADSLERAGRDSLAWSCLCSAAVGFTRLGRGGEAARLAERAHRLALRSGSESMLQDSRMSLASAYLATGRAEEAMEIARDAIEGFARAGDSLGVARSSNFADPTPPPGRSSSRETPGDAVGGAENDSVSRLFEIPLPHARKEAQRLAGPGVQVFLGADASHAKLSETLRGSNVAVFHFATHAVIDAVHPGRSSLLLAGSDGLLRSMDIERLKAEADLVTLSGCRTSGGHVYLGEGTLGLTRSFLIAGARTVVSSLWDVEDRAALRFMTVFYEGLRRGLARDESLHRARLEMAKSGYPPRDRAAFVLTGVGHLPVPALIRNTNRPGWARYLVAVGAGLLLYASVVIGRRKRDRKGREIAGLEKQIRG